MNDIAVLIGNDFEDSEYAKPAEAFKKAGYRLVHIGLKKGETVTGKKERTPVKIDREAGKADPGDFVALLIPGGYSPDNLRAYDEPVQFVRQFMDSNKPVFAICHGPQLLIKAKKLRAARLPAGSLSARTSGMREPNIATRKWSWTETWLPAGSLPIFRPLSRQV